MDATNAIDHDISVITRLGIEHEDILGKDLRSIAENKFGIIRKNNIVFHTEFPEEISDIYSKCLVEKNARFFKAQKLDYFVCKNKYPKYFVNINGIKCPICIASVDGPLPVYKNTGSPFS